MKAFICVYRHPQPNKSKRQKVQKAAKGDRLLEKFLLHYDDPDCFYDWGADPSFFCATELLGDIRLATWGVCRRDVRQQLEEGDLVVYFCARQKQDLTAVWDYYFTGFGTVKECISREDLWTNNSYSRYRSFYNVLVKPQANKFVQHEPFGNSHNDWQRRIEAPYILFETAHSLTSFNIRRPLFVASKPIDSPFEQWRSGQCKLVNRLQTVLFTNLGVTRGLRTKSNQHAHRQIALHKYVDKADQVPSLIQLRDSLLAISQDANALETMT